MIEPCLRSLLEGNAGSGNARFVVADGGSTDATTEIVKRLCAAFSNLKLIDNPKRSQAHAMNLIASMPETAGAEILIRCDAHAVYPEGFLSDLCRALRRTGADSVVVPMDSYGESAFGRGAAWLIDTPFGSGGAAHRGGQHSGFVDHGHHAAFRMARFQELGGYDTGFATNEDAEFDWRLAQAGGRLWLDADIRIRYRMRANIKAFARQYYRYGKGRAQTILKHGMRPKVRQFAPVAMFLCLALAAFATLSVAPEAGLFLLLYVIGAAGIGCALAWRHRSFAGLWAGPALIVSQNFWALGFLITFGRAWVYPGTNAAVQTASQ